MKSWRKRKIGQGINESFAAPNQRQRGLFSTKFWSLFFLLVFSTIVLHKPVLRAYGEWLVPSQEDPSADIAIVVDRNVTRLEAAVTLLREEKVQAIYVNTFDRSWFDKLVKKYDLPTDRTYWGGCQTSTTYAQPFFFVQAYEDQDLSIYESAVIVTSPYHLRRSLWSYQHVLKTKQPHLKLKAYAAPDEKLRKQLDWWQYKYARNWVLNETQKIIFYRVIYGLLNRPNTDIPYSDFFDKEGTKQTHYVDEACASDTPEETKSIPKLQL